MLKLILVIALFAILASGDVIIEPALEKLLQLRSNDPLNIVISMKSSVDPILAQIDQQSFATRGDKLTAISNALEANSNSTQGPVLKFLNTLSQGLPNKPTISSYWISNQISIRGVKSDSITTLASTFAGLIGGISLEQIITLSPIKSSAASVQATNYTWGVQRIEAPAAWALAGASNGVGVIIGHIDSGVRGTHEAVQGTFRGDYGWYE